MNKNLNSFLALTFTAITLFSNAQSHHTAPPPVNPGYPFIRSLSVDCSELIVADIANGNGGGLETDLINYITGNYIGYVILRDMETGGVFGDAMKEAALQQFLIDLHAAVPGIQIGIAAGPNALQNISVPVNISSFSNLNCPGAIFISNYDQLYKEINFPPHSQEEKKRNAIINFFLQAAAFSNNAQLLNHGNVCESGFDAFYLDYPYWNTTTSMTDMQNDFANFKSILSILQILKCNSSCIRFIDAEFLPTDLYKLQGWTSIDQITDADTLIDRVVLPAYTNNPSGVFNLRCKMMHYLSDQFSKTGTKIFVKLNAESPHFNYCNSTTIPNNYLGDYLNGYPFSSGNMYSVEKYFLTSFNNINYVCPACNCSTYVDNHFTANNIHGNILTGSIWTPYTMLQSHQLFRKQNPIAESPEIQIEIYDMLGKSFGIFHSKQQSEAALKCYPNGMYLLIERGKASITCKKIINMN